MCEEWEAAQMKLEMVRREDGESMKSNRSEVVRDTMV